MVIKGESFNDEIDESRHYKEVIDGNIEGGFEIELKEKVFYPPQLKFLNIVKISECGLYGKAFIELPIAGGYEKEVIHETGKKLIEKPFYVSGAIKGCIEAGLKFKLLVAPSYVDVDVRGFAKACAGGTLKYKNTIGFEDSKISVDPLVVGITAKIKSKGYIEFSLVDTTYEYALTKEIPILP